MTALCPHCHQTLPPSHGITIDHLTIRRGPQSINLTLREIRAITPLIQRFSRAVTNDTLIDSIYPLEVDEPGDPVGNVKATMSVLRRKISRFGLSIRPEWGVGYSLQDIAVAEV